MTRGGGDVGMIPIYLKDGRIIIGDLVKFYPEMLDLRLTDGSLYFQLNINIGRTMLRPDPLRHKVLAGRKLVEIVGENIASQSQGLNFSPLRYIQVSRRAFPGGVKVGEISRKETIEVFKSLKQLNLGFMEQEFLTKLIWALGGSLGG